jgi:hypothetical protein
MINNTNSNISNEHINALLNIFHNNGDINLSPYEEHLNFDGILSAEDNPNTETKETDTLLQDKTDNPIPSKKPTIPLSWITPKTKKQSQS